MENKKESPKKEETKIQKMIDGLLENGYSDVDLKAYLKEKFHPRVEKSERELWDKKREGREEDSFRKKAWMYGWPVIPKYDRLVKYILKEARGYEIQEEFKKVLKPNPKNPNQPTPYQIELGMLDAIEIALAFGYVIGELVETTDREPFEHLKQVILEKKLLPYLPRERKGGSHGNYSRL